MKGIGKDLILEVTKGYIPHGVLVIASTHQFYMATALAHPAIQQQMRIGLYDAHTIDEELLSAMCSYVERRVLDVNHALISKQMEDVDTIYAVGYVASMALHERHHFEHHHGGPAATTRKQMERESSCNLWVAENYPEVMRLAEQAERQSAIIQRVQKRIEAVIDAH